MFTFAENILLPFLRYHILYIRSAQFYRFCGKLQKSSKNLWSTFSTFLRQESYRSLDLEQMMDKQQELNLSKIGHLITCSENIS